jgi:hypothetical protein
MEIGVRIKEFNDLILNLNFENVQILNEKLNEASELLKSSEELRQNIDENLYNFLNSKIIIKNLNHEINETQIILMKLLRNSSGTNKSEFSIIEYNLCESLICYLNNQLKLDLVNEISENYKSFNNFILQYFANLIQGNSEAFKLLSNKWFQLATDLIDSDKFMFAFEYSCSILFLFTKKSTKSQIDKNCYFKVLEKTLDDYSESSWSSILINSEFKNVFIEIIFNNNQFFKFSNPKRIILLEILNKNLHLITSESEFTSLINFYERLSTDFLNYLIQIEKSFDDINYFNNLMLEFKQILICINDLSSENDNETEYRRLIQKRELLLCNTCEILNRIHLSDVIKVHFNKEKFDKNEESLEGHVNLKLELIRLIGILVFENEYNRNIVQETKALITIIESVNIDMNNPFIREWSIVTLRHLYYSKEIKN